MSELMYDKLVVYDKEVIAAIEDKIYSLFSTRQSGCFFDSDAQEIYDAVIKVMEDK